MSSTLLGLVAIVIAWVIQFFASLKNQRNLQLGFIMFYAIGTLFLVVDSFSGGLSQIGLLNIGTLFLVLLVWFKSK